MAKRVSLDKVLFSVTLVLVVIGVVFVFSASAVMAKDRYGSPYTFFFRQLAWAVVGLLAMVVIAKINYRHYQRPSVVFTALSVTTLLLLTVFFLDRSHNTHRWIHAGPFSLQPSELAKPAIILFLAYFLESRTRTLNDWRSTLIPAVLPPLLLAALIVGEPDLGTALACLAITICVLFAAGPVLAGVSGALARTPNDGVLAPRRRCSRRRLPHLAVADRRRHRRAERGGAHGRQTEAVLPARAAHRFYFLRHCGRDWPDRRRGRGCALYRVYGPRPPRRD